MKLILKLIERDGMECALCHQSLNDGLLNIDHIVPVSHGGRDIDEDGEANGNLRATHQRCNSQRGQQNCPRCKELGGINGALCAGRLQRLAEIKRESEIEVKKAVAKAETLRAAEQSLQQFHREAQIGPIVVKRFPPPCRNSDGVHKSPCYCFAEGKQVNQSTPSDVNASNAMLTDWEQIFQRRAARKKDING